MNAPMVRKESMPTLTMSEDELINVLQSSLYPGAALQSIKLVLDYCKASNLDPMQKPVHIVPMWSAKEGRMVDVIMPGVNLYRTQAARSGQFAGMSEPEFGPEVRENIGGVEISFPDWCKVTVKRLLPNGVIAEFSAIEFWKENYAVKGGKEKSIAPNAMWQKRPRGQISKCASAQALRIAFPEIASQPTADEMEGKQLYSNEVDVTPAPAPTELPAYTDAQMAENLPKWRDAINAGKSNAAKIINMVATRYTLNIDQTRQIQALEVIAAEPTPEVTEPTRYVDTLNAEMTSEEFGENR